MVTVKDKFHQYFEISGFTNLDANEGKLEKNLTLAIEKVSKIQDRKEVNDYIEKTHAMMDRYYEFARKWSESEKAGKKVQENAEGIKLKSSTFKLAIQLEDTFKEYVTVQMLLAHYHQISKDFLTREEEEMDEIPRIEWTTDTETFLEKYLKNIPKLKEEITRLKDAKILLRKLGEEFDQLKKDILSYYGKTKGQPIFTAYMSGLRQMDVLKSDQAVSNMKRERGKLLAVPGSANKNQIISKAKRLIKEYTDNMTLLMLSEDQIFLKEKEANVSLDVAMKEQKQAQELINKYHYPYLKSRIVGIKKLQERMDEIADVHQILKYYRMVMKGMLVDLNRFEDIRMFETSLKGPLDYLLKDKMTEIPHIKANADDIMAGLQRAIRNRLAKIA